MRAATDAPLDTMRACQQALRGAVVVATNGSRKTTSDVGVAIELLLAGLRGARMNVEINLSTLGDAPYIARVKTEVLELERGAAIDADTARGALR
jgi:formiminotetrahydrofolate cyclodeaminase